MSNKDSSGSKQSKERFQEQAAMLLHKLRSPLLTIKLESGRVKREPSESEGASKVIDSEVDRINDMLDQFWADITGVDDKDVHSAGIDDDIGGLEKKTGLNILIVEDDETHRLIASRLLGNLGHTVFAVADGKAAIVQVEKEIIHVAFIDVRLPDMSGPELATRIRSFADRPTDETIMIGMSNDPRTMVMTEQCEAAGMREYIAKPLTPEKLGILLGR